MASSDAEALMRALGELAVSLRAQPSSSNAEKRTVLRWLRGLSGEQLASLCCVEDVGFVKTLLHMAARSGGGRGGGTIVQEFQLLPPMVDGASIVQNKRVAGKVLPKSAPREFVKRPVVRTMDGDVVGGFHSREYEESCLEVLRGMRVLNTLQSCDTVALSMALCQSGGKGAKPEVFRLMDVISRGGFLMECPSEATLKRRVWGETKWLKGQGYYSLQALLITHIELNIWACWKQYQKDTTAKIPLRGLASKLYLAREWEAASHDQQSHVLKVLGSKTMAHLRDLKQTAPTQAKLAASFQAQRSSLTALMGVLTEYQRIQPRMDKAKGLSVEDYFTCSFEDAVASPQAAVVRLLLAEHLQDQCSLLLCERLSREESSSAVGDTVIIPDNGSKGKAKSANHSQRRRASRKKMLKQRRRESEIRAAQQTHFSEVLRELRQHFRRRQKEAAACASQVLHDVIDAAVDDGRLTPGGWSVASERSAKEDARGRQKKKKRKSKKKRAGLADLTVETGDGKIATSLLTPTKQHPTSTALNFDHVSDEDDAGDHSAATTGSDSSPSQHAPPHLLDCSESGGSEEGPRLSFFSNVGSTGTTTSSISSASALPLPTFSSQSLYSSSTTPFFLSLAPRDHHAQPSRTPRRSLDVDDDDHGGNQTSPRSSAHDPPVSSDSSNFEWYLPSVFSLQTSAHRTISQTPALDWHFNHWQFKAPEGGISEKTSATSPMATELDPPPAPSSSSSTSSASSRFATPRAAGSTRKYSLASFSKMAGMDASRRQLSEQDRQNVTVASIREHGEGASSAAESDNESDFLYREGGFFDRQRATKRRRRPWPFDYAREEDEEEITEEHDARKVGRLNGCGIGKGDKWTECVHCCKCGCHRAAREKGDESTDEELGNNHSHDASQETHQCPHALTGSSTKPSATADSDALAKITLVLDRISLLEEKLDEKTKIMDERAASSSSEIATLKQTVSTLTAQLHNVEHDIQELQLHQSAMSDGLEESSRGNASSCSSSPAPFSPAPSSLDLQSDSPPTAAPPLLPEAYATTNSVMGPFVSVPLSVLPPRSKLHWDLCEFAAQLQADSDARLPAQLAAQRLCTATVQSLWPRAQVRPYGSHVTRLVLPSSDVDLVICLPKVRRDAPADAAGVLEGRNAIKETWQQNLARKLKQEPWVVRDSVKTLPHAAVPIITLLTAPPYNVRLDISFEGPGHNGLATNDVVLSLLHEFPPLAPMMLVLKSFAIERGLAVAYSGGLSSYALLLLVARYLQEHSDTMPNGFANASRAVQHSLSTVQAGVADFGLMLMGFLDFYGNRFDPRTTGISVASRCFLNRESTFMAGAGSGMGDPHQMPHQPQQYQQQYAADDAAVDDRTSQYGYAQHWQVPAQPHMQSLSPNAEAVSVQGLRRYGYRSSLDLPASRALDGMGAATGLLDYQQLQQQTYDPHKFDPVFIEDPLCPSNNVGRNCFRIMQIRRAFSAAHLALLAATRDPTVIAENRMGLVAGVGLHPDNILRSILGPGAPVNAKPDAATSATIGVAPYVGAMEHPYAFLPYNQQQQHYVNHHHQTPQQSHPHVGVPRSVNTYRNEPGSRRHSESESEKLTTRSATSAAIHTDRSHRRLVPENHSGDSHSQAQSRVERGRQPQRQSSLKQIHGQSGTKALSRKNSERSMSLSLSFADVVRDGGGTNSGGFVPKTSPLALARPPRFSRDDMALEESINERWETKDDSDLK